MINLIYFFLNVLVFALIPLIFAKLRGTLRYILNYTYLGCLFVFSNILGSIYAFRISSSIQISGGNIAYSAMLMAILFMVVSERDLTIIRNIVYSILILNVIFFLLYQIIFIFLKDNSIVNPLNISPLLFNMTINIVIAGTLLIIFELVLMFFLFEKIKKYVKNYELTSFIYLIIYILVLILDGFLFPIFAFTLDPNLRYMIIGGIQGKFVLGLMFSIPIFIFMILNHEKLSRYIEQPLPLKDLILWPRLKLIQQIRKSDEQYREAYDQAEFYKDLFAHDISNILHNIKTSIDLIIMFRKESENLDRFNELTELINEQITRGRNMVSNIRKLSLLSDIEEDLKSIELFKVIKESIRFIETTYYNKRIDIQIRSQIEDVFVYANIYLLFAFKNILINAINYNNSQKIEVFIVISHEKRDGIKYVKIEVKDNGIGIADELKERLFKKVLMTEDRSKRMGLGLLLANKFISLFKGEISVKDRIPGDYSKGTNIIVLLPEV